MEKLKINQLFSFPGKKAVYRVVNKTDFFIQYENVKRENSLYEVGYHQKAWYKPVEISDN